MYIAGKLVAEFGIHVPSPLLSTSQTGGHKGLFLG